MIQLLKHWKVERYVTMPCQTIVILTWQMYLAAVMVVGPLNCTAMRRDNAIGIREATA